MLERLITPDQAGAVFDILVEHAGAYADAEGREKWSFYPEHATPERLAIIEKVNGLLARLFVEGAPDA